MSSAIDSGSSVAAPRVFPRALGSGGRRRAIRAQAILVCVIPLGTLAALGGAHAAATLPLLAAAAITFLITGARVGNGDERLLDVALVALTAGILIQLVPLPRNAVALASPHLEPLRTALYLETAPDALPLTANPLVTRAALASLASTLFVFWAARQTFGRGGLRSAAMLIAAAGLLLVIVSLVLRTTAPRQLLWAGRPSDAEAQPFGPFVNPNHMATWLLMAASVTAGYLVAHARAIGALQPSLRLRLRDWLADGKGPLLAGALLVMILGIAATLSRAAILGAATALAVGFGIPDVGRRGKAARLVGGVAGLLLALALWFNHEALLRKFDAVTTLSRLAIWRDTLPLIGDFWLTGTGAGTYGPAMLHYQRAFRDVHFNQAHSEYLQLAAEGGLLLVVPAMAALAAALMLGWRRLRSDSRPVSWLRVGAAAGLAAAAVQGVFETGLRIPANGLLAAVLAAIVLHQPHDR